MLFSVAVVPRHGRPDATAHGPTTRDVLGGTAHARAGATIKRTDQLPFPYAQQETFFRDASGRFTSARSARPGAQQHRRLGAAARGVAEVLRLRLGHRDVSRRPRRARRPRRPRRPRRRAGERRRPRPRPGPSQRAHAHHAECLLGRGPRRAPPAQAWSSTGGSRAGRYGRSARSPAPPSRRSGPTPTRRAYIAAARARAGPRLRRSSGSGPLRRARRHAPTPRPPPHVCVADIKHSTAPKVLAECSDTPP